MRVAFLALLLSLLAGCVSVEKIDSGDRLIGERMTITLEGSWNEINSPGLGPAKVWTMEGLPVNQLLLYSGLNNGEAIHATTAGGDEKKTFVFRSGMQPDEIVALFDGMLTRDGSRFSMTKLEPYTFGGSRGFRFEYALTRKVDNAQLSGVGYGAVSKGQLFALVYMAPRLTFFQRHAARVEQISRSARVKE